MWSRNVRHLECHDAGEKLERVQKPTGAEGNRKERYSWPLKSFSAQSAAHALLTKEEDENAGSKEEAVGKLRPSFMYIFHFKPLKRALVCVLVKAPSKSSPSS